MKNRPRGKKMGIIILAALIIISLADIIFRTVAIGEATLTTSNLGEQLAVIVLAVTILILTAKGKDRACYICYGAWIAYFVLDNLFELPGAIIVGISGLMTGEATFLLAFGGTLRYLSMLGVIAIGVLLVEYMCDGTIYNRAFNTLSVVTTLLILSHVVIPAVGAIASGNIMPVLDTLNGLYRMAMIFLFVFFAYDSAKMQLERTNLSK